MSSIPPGWYPDPSGEHQFRYWDGQGWTTRTAYPKNPQQARPAEQPKQTSIRTRTCGSSGQSRTDH
ncbi:MAG: DUF2510 domain-containing protein [Gammaproteobacteria bacterium]|nr:DUF2510 domain-containing protein [Gammaproteobacteria bacterium]